MVNLENAYFHQVKLVTAWRWMICKAPPDAGPWLDISISHVHAEGREIKRQESIAVGFFFTSVAKCLIQNKVRTSQAHLSIQHYISSLTT
jgi:hypothetical protein